MTRTMPEDRSSPFQSPEEEPINYHFVDDRWVGSFPDLFSHLKPLMETVLRTLALDLSRLQEVNVVFEGDQRLRELNKTFRGKDNPTNVLSFPYEEDPLVGDIFISYDRVTDESKAQDKSPRDHLLHLVLHGFLHLLGYDHESEEDAQEMESLEIKILGTLGISNPYEEREGHV